METKRCEICGKTLPLSAFSKSYKGRCKKCVARLTKEKRNSTATTTHKTIDWEQRRYEIAKHMLRAIYKDGVKRNVTQIQVLRLNTKVQKIAQVKQLNTPLH